MKTDNCFRRFFTLIGVDFYKLFRSVSFYVVFGILALYNLLSIIISAVANSFLIDLGQTEGLLVANPLFADSLSYGNMGLFLVILFAVFLCSEFRSNTIRYKISTGYSRTCVYFASLTFTYIVSLMAIALSCIVDAAVGIPVLGWQHTDYAMQQAFYSLFALLPLVALIHTLAYGTRSMGITLGAGLPIIIILPGILSLVTMFVFASTGVEWFTRIVFIALQSYVPSALLEGPQIFPYLELNVSLCYILWTALFIGLGYLSFVKRDIK